MLRPPATLRVAIQAGIAMQAGEKNEIRNRVRSAEMLVSKIYSSISLRKTDFDNLFREIDDIFANRMCRECKNIKDFK